MEKTTDPRPSINTFFEIAGDDLDPEECTRRIGLTPTEAEISGRSRPGGRLPVRVTHWTIKLEKRRVYTIDEPLTELLDILWPKRSKIMTFLLSQPFPATFGTNVTIYEDRPEYCLSPETIQRLAYFKSEYCLDIFDYRD